MAGSEGREGRRQKALGRKQDNRFLLSAFCFLPSAFYLLPFAFCLLSHLSAASEKHYEMPPGNLPTRFPAPR